MPRQLGRQSMDSVPYDHGQYEEAYYEDEYDQQQQHQQEYADEGEYQSGDEYYSGEEEGDYYSDEESEEYDDDDPQDGYSKEERKRRVCQYATLCCCCCLVLLGVGGYFAWDLALEEMYQSLREAADVEPEGNGNNTNNTLNNGTIQDSQSQVDGGNGGSSETAAPTPWNLNPKIWEEAMNVPAIADTYIRSGKFGNTTFGTSTDLLTQWSNDNDNSNVDGDNNDSTISMMQFDISSLQDIHFDQDQLPEYRRKIILRLFPNVGLNTNNVDASIFKTSIFLDYIHTLDPSAGDDNNADNIFGTVNLNLQDIDYDLDLNSPNKNTDNDNNNDNPLESSLTWNAYWDSYLAPKGDPYNAGTVFWREGPVEKVQPTDIMMDMDVTDLIEPLLSISATSSRQRRRKNRQRDRERTLQDHSSLRRSLNDNDDDDLFVVFRLDALFPLPLGGAFFSREFAGGANTPLLVHTWKKKPPKPSESPSISSAPTVTVTKSPAPTQSNGPTQSSVPTISRTPTMTPTISASPTTVASSAPTMVASNAPSSPPTKTNAPTPVESSTPTLAPSNNSSSPSSSPSFVASSTPTAGPTP